MSKKKVEIKEYKLIVGFHMNVADKQTPTFFSKKKIENKVLYILFLSDLFFNLIFSDYRTDNIIIK